MLLGHPPFCFRLYVTSGSSHAVRIKCAVCRQLSVMSEFCYVKGIRVAGSLTIFESPGTNLIGSGLHI
jgi:hypothetical protein